MSYKNQSILSQLYLLDEPPVAPKPIIKAFKGLSSKLQGHSVPWRLTVTEKAFKQIQNDQESYQKELEKIDFRYLVDVFEPTEKVFDYLKPAKINRETFEKYNQVDTTGHVLTFQPNHNGFAQTVQYDRVATTTGRLKTVSGPMLLHLPKVYRNILESRWINGKIISLDYKSLEPRVLLATMGIESEKDVYQDVKNNLFPLNDEITRDVVKRIVLSELYGAGIDKIKEKLTAVAEVENIVEQIKKYFLLDQLKTKLYSEWITNNQKYITNFYGRRIKTETSHTLVNHYVQSTAVDVALLGFKNILTYLEGLERLNDIVPLFILHDAIIFDVNLNVLELINGLCKVGSVEIKNLETTTFYMSIDKDFANP